MINFVCIRALAIFLIQALTHAVNPSRLPQSKDPIATLDTILQLSHTLHTHCAAASSTAANEKNNSAIKGGNGAAQKNKEALMQVYSRFCIATLARLLQNPKLRHFSSKFLAGLPSIPMGCLKLLKLLMVSGSKLTVEGTDGTNKSRGVRSESLFTLTSIVFMKDENAAFASFNLLLWCALSEEETRLKVIPNIIRYVYTDIFLVHQSQYS